MQAKGFPRYQENFGTRNSVRLNVPVGPPVKILGKETPCDEGDISSQSLHLLRVPCVKIGDRVWFFRKPEGPVKLGTSFRCDQVVLNCFESQRVFLNGQDTGPSCFQQD